MREGTRAITICATAKAAALEGEARGEPILPLRRPLNAPPSMDGDNNRDLSGERRGRGLPSLGWGPANKDSHGSGAGGGWGRGRGGGTRGRRRATKATLRTNRNGILPSIWNIGPTFKECHADQYCG